MKKLLLFFFIPLLLSCSKNRSENTDKPFVESEKKLTSKKIASNEVASKSFLDIDLRIAGEFIKDINNKDERLRIDHYEAYFEDKNLYLRILEKEYGLKDSVELILDQNLESVIKRVRKSVISDYERFASLEGRYFSFLYNVQDTSVNRLLEDIRTNERASPVELERLGETYSLIIE